MNHILALALTVAIMSTGGCTSPVESPTPPEELDTYASINLDIESIEESSFTGVLPYPYPCVYTVAYDLSDEYCVGDRVKVYYSDLTEDKSAHTVGKWTAQVTAVWVEPSDFELRPDTAYKPVIYLYPEEETDVTVTLDYAGELTHTWPLYQDGWQVTAAPDGTLTDQDGIQYPYLFWEGICPVQYDMSHGFCVSGADSKSFLQETLSYMGLSEQEIEDFLEFWLPYLEKNPYNLLAFQGASYTNTAPLSITPAPDSLLRVYLTYSPLTEPVQVPPQKLNTWQRTGFAVVEWGGGIAPLS